MRNTCICIYPKDVQRILGKSYRAASLLIQNIKIRLGKKSYQPVTIAEFCDYLQLPLQEVESRLQR